MMAVFDLYGLNLDDLDLARARVEAVLEIRLDARESDYLGKYYRFDYGKGEHVVLQRNFDSIENEWFEENFKMYPVLLYVNETPRSTEFERRLQTGEMKFELLRRKEVQG